MKDIVKMANQWCHQSRNKDSFAKNMWFFGAWNEIKFDICIASRITDVTIHNHNPDQSTIWTFILCIALHDCNNKMKVLRASRKVSAWSSLDGARIGSLRPAKQISPLGKIWAIWIPVLPVLPAVLPVLLLPLEIPMLAKIPNSLKYFFFLNQNTK